jgi:hypothetical protein
MPKGVIMRPEEYHPYRLVELLEAERILTLDRVTDGLGKPSRMTVFRKLAQLGGRASYSHHGRYHTLDRIAEYDRNGLWSHRGVHFSRQGTLLRTILHLVEHSAQGCFASELQALLQVRVHNPLARLHGAQLLVREQIGDQYLYVSPTGGKEQLEERYEAIQQAHDQESHGIQDISGEMGESMRLLLSALNEKQRRLYLGLESIRLGHGGDAKISLVTGVNVKTIARGRQELQARNITAERIRDVGGGRPSFKKKRRDGTPGRTDESGHSWRSDE